MNILRNIILLGWMAIACTAFAQDRNADKVERPNTKKINFGIKAGFNSSMFMVSELKIKEDVYKRQGKKALSKSPTSFSATKKSTAYR